MVIKVGMVGDSQIGKTSLMVKYVEGSFDEDYIQTLGTCFETDVLSSSVLTARRRQLHGKNDLGPPNHHHFLDMGLGRPARVREYAAVSVQ